MKICIPTQKDEGLQSIVYGHFGSAPFFILHDTASKETRTLVNKNEHHAHGACMPTTALGSEKVDTVLVGGLGARALAKLNGMGIKAYQAINGTVEENLAATEAGELSEMTSAHACSGHHH